MTFTIFKIFKTKLCVRFSTFQNKQIFHVKKIFQVIDFASEKIAHICVQWNTIHSKINS